MEYYNLSHQKDSFNIIICDLHNYILVMRPINVHIMEKKML